MGKFRRYQQTIRDGHIVNAERIVFIIKGNDYRLLVAVDFEKATVWIKWIGAHKTYDRIDVTKVKHGD